MTTPTWTKIVFFKLIVFNYKKVFLSIGWVIRNTDFQARCRIIRMKASCNSNLISLFLVGIPNTIQLRVLQSFDNNTCKQWHNLLKTKQRWSEYSAVGVIDTANPFKDDIWIRPWMLIAFLQYTGRKFLFNLFATVKVDP